MLRDGDDLFYYIDMYLLVSLIFFLYNCYLILEMILCRRFILLWLEYFKFDEEIFYKNVIGSF